MKRDHRRGNRYGERLSKIVRDSFTSDFARESGSRLKSFVTAQPVLATCLGIAAGFVLGTMVRRVGR